MTMTTTTTVTGNLTRDPEIRYTRDGQAATTLGLAVNRRWLVRDTQQWEESTSFFDVVCWRDLAENVALSLTKGMRVVVTGRLEQRSWETENGERRSKLEIVADDLGPSLRFASAEVHRAQRRAAATDEGETGGTAGDLELSGPDGEPGMVEDLHGPSDPGTPGKVDAAGSGRRRGGRTTETTGAVA